MADYPALPLWTDAYLADLHPRLSLEEHGCMILLMQFAWRSPECQFRDDDKFIARMLSITVHRWRTRLRPVMEMLWMVENGQWRQKRLQKEWRFVRKKSQQSSAAAQARWLKNNETDDADAPPPQCERNAPTPTPTPTPIEELDPNGSCQLSSEKLPVQKAFDNYVQMASDLKLPIPRKLTEQRKRHLRARLKEHGIEGWNDMLYRLAESNWCLGNNPSGWTADFDWLLGPKNFNKVLDGNYVREEATA